MAELSFILQARSGSTRLPNKLALPFFKKKGILETIVENLKIHFPDIPLILATTENTEDEQLVSLGVRQNIHIFRGSSTDVLERFVKAADKFNVKKIIRICADNPFLDMWALGNLTRVFKISSADYIGFSTSLGKPSIKTHYGFWAEGVRLEALKKAQKQTNSHYYREHVTNYIYERPELFKLDWLPISKKIEESEIRLTVDTFEDFEVAKQIYFQLKSKNISKLEDIVFFVQKEKNWTQSMRQQIRKNQK